MTSPQNLSVIIAPRCFTTPSHRKVHSGHTTCDFCHHQFSTVGTLNRHIRKVHKVEPRARAEAALDFSQPILYKSLSFK